MKLHVNSPVYAKGQELEVMGIGTYPNGTTVELTDVQVNALKSQGFDVPSDGDMYVYKEAEAPKSAEAKTDNLPGIAEVAEKERAKAGKEASKQKPQ